MDKTKEQRYIELQKKFPEQHAYFENLVRKSDAENMALCSNKALEKDIVYNSDSADLGLRIRMSKRNLGGLTISEFKKRYRQVLKTDEEKRNNEMALTLREESMVPLRIEPAILANTGHTEGYLLKACSEYEITARDLKDLAELKQKYKTNFPAMLSLVKRGYKTEDIAEFLEAREMVSASTVFGLNPDITLKSLVKLQERFSSEPVDSDNLAGMLEQIIEQVKETITTDRRGNPNIRYLNSILIDVLKISKEYKIDFEASLEAYFEGVRVRDESGRVQTKGEHTPLDERKGQDSTFYFPDRRKHKGEIQNSESDD